MATRHHIHTHQGGTLNRGQKNKNPGNLRYAGQKESIGADDKGFAVFPTDQAGWRALVAQIKKDQDRGMTILEFTHKYAPPHENDTNQYARTIAEGLNARWGDLLLRFSPHSIAGIVANHEGYLAKETT